MSYIICPHCDTPNPVIVEECVACDNNIYQEPKDTIKQQQDKEYRKALFTDQLINDKKKEIEEELKKKANRFSTGPIKLILDYGGHRKRISIPDDRDILNEQVEAFLAKIHLDNKISDPIPDYELRLFNRRLEEIPNNAIISIFPKS